MMAASSLRIRKRIEEAFGWAKTVGGIARLKVRGLARAEAAFTFLHRCHTDAVNDAALP